jgi:hypothetical protein
MKYNEEKELKVRPDRENITPLDCSSCEDGVSIPVMGIAPEGREVTPSHSLHRCHQIFCPNSLYRHKGPMYDGDITEVQEEMTRIARELKENGADLI